MKSGAAGQAAMSADEYNGPDDGGMGYEPEPEERPLRDPERVSRVRRPVTSAERASQVRRTVEPAERASRVRRPAENAERVGTERPTAPSDQKEEKAGRVQITSEQELPEETVPGSEIGIDGNGAGAGEQAAPRRKSGQKKTKSRSGRKKRKETSADAEDRRSRTAEERRRARKAERTERIRREEEDGDEEEKSAGILPVLALAVIPVVLLCLLIPVIVKRLPDPSLGGILPFGQEDQAQTDGKPDPSENGKETGAPAAAEKEQEPQPAASVPVWENGAVEQAVRTAAEVPTGEITVQDLDKVTYLDLSNAGIRDLSDRQRDQ